jgi:hypothetical protein
VIVAAAFSDAGGLVLSLSARLIVRIPRSQVAWYRERRLVGESVRSRHYRRVRERRHWSWTPVAHDSYVTRLAAAAASVSTVFDAGARYGME